MNSNRVFFIISIGAVLGTAYILYKYFNKAPLPENKLAGKLSEIRDLFSLSLVQQEKNIHNFLLEMRAGLLPNSQSSLKMIPTYVTSFPKGTEVGHTYALDIGGSNIRVLEVIFKGNGNITIGNTYKQSIPVEIQQSDADTLFSFIADCVGTVVKGKQDIGFTFSFPVHHTSIKSGDLIEWSKGFTAVGVEKTDVADQLNRALEKRNIPVKVNALIDDTVGTLLASCYEETYADCCIGVIVGTGLNLCYIDQIENIKKFQNTNPDITHMIINMESGNFGSRSGYIGEHLTLTRWDVILNERSVNVDKQFLEKQVSGMYLGEILRLVLEDCNEKGVLFCGQDIHPRFHKAYELSTASMSEIETDLYPYKKTLDVLKTFGIQSTPEEREFVQNISRSIARRSAILCSNQIAACVKYLDKEMVNIAVAVDGSVLLKYPGYKEMVLEYLKELGLNKIRLVIPTDGSGIGAAVASLMHP